jgi:hypothetical protein
MLLKGSIDWLSDQQMLEAKEERKKNGGSL